MSTHDPTFNGQDPPVIEHLMAAGNVLPSQSAQHNDWTPEKRLAGAVLASALTTVRDYYDHPTRAQEVREDLAWILSDDPEAPFSFLRLCDVFGLDPEWVRATVARWRTTPRHARAPFSMSRHAA